MRVKLLKDVREGGQFGALGQVVNAGDLKVAKRPGREAVRFAEGEIIDMSTASAEKYIAAGFAEPADA